MPDSKYCYPGTEVLINKLNIREAPDLLQAEKAISYANAALSKEQQTKGRQKVNIENKELNGGLSRGRIDQRDASARGK